MSRPGSARLLVSFCLLFGQALLASSGIADDGVERREKGSLTLENIPRNAFAEGKSISSFQTTTGTYDFAGYDLDGRYLYFTRNDNIYRALSKGRTPSLVADTKLSLDGAHAVRICEKAGFVFRRDTDGDEYQRVYLYSRGGGEPQQISEGTAQNIHLTFDDRREKVAYASAEKNSGVWKLVTHSFCGDTSPKAVFTAESSVVPSDWSPNGEWILANLPGDNRHQLVLIHSETGASRLLIESEDAFGSAVFSADGKKVFFISRQWTDNDSLFQVDVDSGNIVALTSSIKLDVEGLVLSRDRTRMAVLLNQHGFHKLLFIDTVKLKVVPGAPEKSPGVIRSAAFSGDNNSLAMSIRHPNSPRRTVVYRIDRQKLEIWTGGFNPGQKMADNMPTILQYPTFDKIGEEQRQISALLYVPQNRPAGAKLPVLIDVHGGPVSQARAEHSFRRDYYVAKLGIAVIEPNIRGSSGYGKTFEQLDDGYRREDAVKDIGALLDWIARDDRFDADRVAIRGGSYGGYVTLAALFHYGDRFRAGIDVVGISDFTTFLENTERNRVENRRREYGDERDPEMRAFFETISPLRNVERIVSPLLIAHGALDPRVPLGEAEQIRDAVRAQGVPVWYLKAADEGHGFSKRDNGTMLTGASSLFLKKYLLDQ